jgi:hypothetical protein
MRGLPMKNRWIFASCIQMNRNSAIKCLGLISTSSSYNPNKKLACDL